MRNQLTMGCVAAVVSVTSGFRSVSADTVTLDLPELIGIHELGPSSFIASSWADFVVDFDPLIELTIDITATGVPGSLGGNPIPAVLEMDVFTYEYDVGWAVHEDVPLGPFGSTPSTEQINFSPIPGDDGGRYPGIYSVVLKWPDGLGEYDTPPQVHVTSATITAEFTPVDRPCYCGGDINGDGFVGIGDLNVVLGNWNMTIPPGDPIADPSGDGFVGIDDLNLVLGSWNAGQPPALPGDLCPDSIGGCGGTVGIEELNVVLGNWNMNAPPANPDADNSGDGYIGIDDLNGVLSQWNPFGVPPIANAVPEPGTLILLAASCAALLRRSESIKTADTSAE